MPDRGAERGRQVPAPLGGLIDSQYGATRQLARMRRMRQIQPGRVAINRRYRAYGLRVGEPHGHAV